MSLFILGLIGFPLVYWLGLVKRMKSERYGIRNGRNPTQSQSGQNPAADYGAAMIITLPPSLNQLVDRLVHSGRYAYESDVVREALRVLERQELDESPALEAAILEGVSSPHQPYDSSVMDRIRLNARSMA